MDLQKKIEQWLVSQQNDWNALRNAIAQLDMVQTKTLSWGNQIQVQVQYNAARFLSASSKTDKASIDERPCFLCEKNRPAEQTAISFLDKYAILANPYPILKNHLTIALLSHKPQVIRRKIGDMLDLAQQLPDYVVFYNGPKCGASAPDHFHLQAGLKSPFLMQGDNELRSCLVVESASKQEVVEHFEDVYSFLQSKQPDEDEPMFNLIAFSHHNKYVLHIFPRKTHRPRQFFYEGKQQLLISPGALDMAGLLVASREEDFQKIKKEDIEDIFSQVSMPIL